MFVRHPRCPSDHGVGLDRWVFSRCRRPASAGSCSISRPVRAEAERTSPLPERPRSTRPGAWTSPKPPRALLRLLEFLAVDHDAASDLSDRLVVLCRPDVQAHFIAGLE